jgi:lysyl-tRNA synthetase class 2
MSGTMSADNWQPTATIDTLKRRAQLLAEVRRFFAERGVLEVETPVLSQAAPTATYLDSFTSHYLPPGSKAQTYYLQTSPEFPMKRLLAAGSGDIYQIARVFRNGELGRLHNPEFTLLEWYRPTLDYQGLMEEVDALLQAVAGLPGALRFSYQQLFKQYLKLDPLAADDEQLRQTALASIPGLPTDWHTDRDGWLEMLMSEVIEPALKTLKQPVMVYDFPASQAQLARIVKNNEGVCVASRFEVYAGGLELANGYDECIDADELQQRFEADNSQRRQQGKKPMPIDVRLLAAIEQGLPACTGVALGLDRLLLLISGLNDIKSVQSFGFARS